MKLATISIKVFYCFAVVSAVFAEPKVEYYKKGIKEAESLILNKERSKAVKTLLDLLETEKQNKTAMLEIKKILKEINSYFLNEKAQQNFELALNLKKTDPAQSMQKLKEAERWEPDNFRIAAEISRQKIVKKECKELSVSLENFLKINPWDENLSLALSQVYFCTGEFEKSMHIVHKVIDPKRKNNKAEWLQIEILNKIKTKEFVKAKEILQELKEKDSGNPQIVVYEALMSTEEKPSLDVLTKNFSACKSISPSQYRKYQQDPFFCELELLISLM